MTMTSNSKLRRDDGKIFIATRPAHWSDIQSITDNETDSVKWVGYNIYVSSSKGYTYELLS